MLGTRIGTPVCTSVEHTKMPTLNCNCPYRLYIHYMHTRTQAHAHAHTLTYIRTHRSIKHYFLLDQGDFFVHFMDAAGEELRKNVPGQ